MAVDWIKELAEALDYVSPICNKLHDAKWRHEQAALLRSSSTIIKARGTMTKTVPAVNESPSDDGLGAGDTNSYEAWFEQDDPPKLPDGWWDEDQVAQADARIAALETELRNIADAKPHGWEDPDDFRAWAQNRARHALTPNAELSGGLGKAPEGDYMDIIEPGHVYNLQHLDGCGKTQLIFVAREAERKHEGTTNQEVIRALIDRVLYLDQILPWDGNTKSFIT